MFYVFGINGPMYQGGAQRLSHITAVRGVQRPSGLRAGASGVEGQESQIRHSISTLSAKVHDAVNAYLDTEQGPKEERRQIYTVQDVMTQGAVTLPPDINVEQAWQVLAEKRLPRLPYSTPRGWSLDCCCALTWPRWRCCLSQVPCSRPCCSPSARSRKSWSRQCPR